MKNMKMQQLNLMHSILAPFTFAHVKSLTLKNYGNPPNKEWQLHI